MGDVRVKEGDWMIVLWNISVKERDWVIVWGMLGLRRVSFNAGLRIAGLKLDTVCLSV